jgi:hypothetical protein
MNHTNINILRVSPQGAALSLESGPDIKCLSIALCSRDTLPNDSLTATDFPALVNDWPPAIHENILMTIIIQLRSEVY